MLFSYGRQWRKRRRHVVVSIIIFLATLLLLFPEFFSRLESFFFYFIWPRITYYCGSMFSMISCSLSWVLPFLLRIFSAFISLFRMRFNIITSDLRQTYCTKMNKRGEKESKSAPCKSWGFPSFHRYMYFMCIEIGYGCECVTSLNIQHDRTSKIQGNRSTYTESIRLFSHVHGAVHVWHIFPLIVCLCEQISGKSKRNTEIRPFP